MITYFSPTFHPPSISTSSIFDNAELALEDMSLAGRGTCIQGARGTSLMQQQRLPLTRFLRLRHPRELHRRL